MAFIPTLTSCAVNVDYLLSKITDPSPGIVLCQTDNRLKPYFTHGFDDIVCQDVIINWLKRGNVSVSGLGELNGDTTMAFLIRGKVTRKNQSQFRWAKWTGLNMYDTSTTFGVHIPWSTGVVYIDHANSATGRLSVTYL